jgi:hypothetical protein
MPILTWWWGLRGQMILRATGRASPARPFQDDGPEKKGYPGPPCWKLGVGLTASPRKKYGFEAS